MKTKLFYLALSSLLLALPAVAQNKTVVTANNNDISDNLDLRAIATIFGDASNLDDFEKRINDPKSQISNLDLNNDNLVDYLRVVESVEKNDHIIVIQAVLEKDVYQDVASIEVQKTKNNKVQVQVVGDVYMYGDNYIYEPIYTHVPVIYNTFWVNTYRPYCSSYYWNYYPDYYTCWNPFPIFRYRNHISLHINFGYNYNYVNYRNCHDSYYSYYGRRGKGYEINHPDYSFHHRNSGFSNRYDMDNHRDVRTRVNGGRELTNTYNQPRNNNREDSPRNSQPRFENPRNEQPRIEQPRTESPRNSQPRFENPRNEQPRIEQPRTESPRNAQPRFENPRSEQPRIEQPRTESPRNSQPRFENPRNEQPRIEQPRTESPRNSQPRMESPRNSGSENRGGRENSGRGRG